MNNNPLFCVLGVYGKGNIGDEALLLAIADALKDAYKDVRVVAFCSDAGVVEEQFQIAAVSRAPFPNFLQKFQLVKNAKAIIIGGGTLLCDHPSLIDNIRALAAIFFWPAIARLLRVPTIIYGQGVGPASSTLVRWSIRHLLGRTARVSLRDRHSRELVQEIMSRSSQLIVACDPVVGSGRFLPEVLTDSIPDDTITRFNNLRPFCAVSIRYPKHGYFDGNSQYFRSCIETLVRFYSNREMRIIFFPAHLSTRHNDDTIVAECFRKRLIEANLPKSKVAVVGWATVEEGFAFLQRAEIVFADRLHALLPAAMAGVPIVGINIEDKISGCLQMIGLGESCSLIDPQDVGSKNTVNTLIVASRTNQEKRKQLSARTKNYAARDHKNRALLVNF